MKTLTQGKKSEGFESPGLKGERVFEWASTKQFSKAIKTTKKGSNQVVFFYVSNYHSFLSGFGFEITFHNFIFHVSFPLWLQFVYLFVQLCDMFSVM